MHAPSFRKRAALNIYSLNLVSDIFGQNKTNFV